jgi:pyruvate dehydrogenase E2 component (dihydrolipoamide acetyltransferase)
MMLSDIRVPDIGDFKDVPIIQILVSVGDRIKTDDPLVVLESDKATIDVPAPAAGVVRELKAAVGDRMSQGGLLLTLEVASSSQDSAAPSEVPAAMPHLSASSTASAGEGGVLAFPSTAAAAEPKIVEFGAAGGRSGTRIHAGPSVRALARRLGVDLAKVRGSGRTQRIVAEDVQAYVKSALQGQKEWGAGAARANDALPAARADFAKYGPIERRALSRIQRISGLRLADNWARIPHVTNFHDVDITELEAFRLQTNHDRGGKSQKLSILPFLIKACSYALKKHPRLNSSLDGEELVFKNYFHIGFAADTSEGLLVPVIRDVDKKGLFEIAAEAADLAEKARKLALKSEQMEGGCFTISSLGGIGGGGFTPIINSPEAAILGAGKATMQPRWDGDKFIPRLILPVALSWDHRIVDGALAARFLVDLAALLQDLRRALL